jgi:chemotaxis receptor (MCP) glutamine deamidase CheD
MAHIALPATLLYHSNHDQRPGYYADEIVPRMIEDLRVRYGCRPSQMLIHVIGGANSKSQKDPFQVGKRNVDVVSSILKEHQLKFDATQVGGHVSRTVYFKNATGELEIRTQNMVL